MELVLLAGLLIFALPVLILYIGIMLAYAIHGGIADLFRFLVER